MPETLTTSAPSTTYDFAAMTAGMGFLPALIPLRPTVSAKFAGRRRRLLNAPQGAAQHHVWLAGTRLRMNLLAWASQEPQQHIHSCDPPTAMAMLMADSKTQSLLNAALSKAAGDLALHEPDDVLARLDDLALDFAGVEDMRDGVVAKTKALVRVLALARGVDLGQERLIRQCGLLLVPALSRMRARLEAADQCAKDILGALRDIAATQAFLRACTGSNSSQEGWTRMLALWAGSGATGDWADELQQTHAFLASNMMGDIVATV